MRTSLIGLTGVEGDATVIEKHTYARVITEEFEGTDLPAQAAPLSPVAGAEALELTGVTGQRKRQTRLAAAVVAAILIAVAIGVFVYLKRAQVSPSPISRPKSTLVRLTNNNTMDGSPVWSPDGSRIAFWSNRDGKNEIYVMDADGGKVSMLTTIPNSAFVPAWSPDGAKIALTVDTLGSRANIYQMDLDGGNLRRVTAGPKYDTRPAFSPDGSKLAFQSNRDGNYEIYVMNLR